MATRPVVVSLSAQVSGYVSGMDKAARKTKETTDDAQKRLENQREAMEKLGGQAVKFGAVTAASLALTAKAAIDWESAWTGVKKTVDGTPEQLADIEAGLRALAKELPASHAEIAAVAEAAGQLGVQSGAVVEFTKVMIDLGETTNLSADEAATSIAQLMNIMQTAPDQVDNLGSSLVALGNDGASTERDIIQMAQRIAGAGKIIGLTEGEVLGFANALASVGIDAEAGGSAISRIMTDIAKSVSTGGEDLEGFAKVAGMSAQDFSAAFKGDPADAIATFIEGLGEVNAAGGDVFTTLSDLGQSDIRVSNALLGMANAGDLLRESLELGNTSWEDNTALMTEAEKRYATVEAQLQMTQGAINDAAISFGTTLLPAISDAASGVAEFAGWMSELPEPVLAVGAGVVTLTTGVALFGGGLLLLTPRIAATRAAMIQMDMTGTNLAKTIGKGGLLMAGIAVATTAASGLGRVGELAAVDLAKLDAALSNSGESAADLDALFSGMQGTTNATNGMAEAADKLTSSGLDGWIYKINKNAWGATDAVLGWIPAIKDLSNGITKNEAQFTKMGESLAALSKDDFPAASSQFQALAEELGGGKEEFEQLLKLMPDYKAALIDAAAAAGQATDDETILALAMEEGSSALTTRAEKLLETKEAAAVAAASTDEWLIAIAEQNAAFVSLNGAFDTVIEKNRATAEATAASSASTTDSWDDFYDGFSVSTADYLVELQAQVDAQNNWESNMVMLSGRVSSAVLDELGKLGPEGAPLVAQLVTASDEELAKLETLYAERAAAATGAFAQKLSEAQVVIGAASAQIGQAAADEIAAKLAAGTHTVAQIMAEYGLKIESLRPEVQISTSQAQANLDAFIANNQGRELGVRVANGRGSGGMTFADGGPIHGVGGPRQDNIPIMASVGEHMLDAEDVKRLGGHAGVYKLRESLYRGYADGGAIQYAPPTYMSSGGSSASPAGERPIYMDGTLFGVLREMANGEAQLVVNGRDRAAESMIRSRRQVR